MPIILQTGYEDSIRSKFGVKKGELPDEAINSRLILDLAESIIVKRVPNYSLITDTVEKLLLEGAVISYMCYLLAPSMSRRVNLELTALDVRWKKDKVDWTELGQLFLAEVDTHLNQITSVLVDEGNSADSSIGTVIRPDGVRIV